MLTDMEKVDMLKARAPAYAKVANDGAKHRCNDCQQEHTHDSVILCATPAGKKLTLLCLDCVDSGWLKLATQMDWSI
jgi:hypothetical protein